MPLAKCYDCASQISVHASACPECGMPVRQIAECAPCRGADCVHCDALGLNALPAPPVTEWKLGLRFKQTVALAVMLGVIMLLGRLMPPS